MAFRIYQSDAGGEPARFTRFAQWEDLMRKFMAMLVSVGLIAVLGLGTTGCGKKKEGKGPEKGKFTVSKFTFDEIKDVKEGEAITGKGTVEIARGEGFDGDVELVFEGALADIEFKADKIAKGKTSADVQISGKVKKADDIKAHPITVKAKSGDVKAEEKADLKLVKK
jgi:hypothetical protein